MKHGAPFGVAGALRGVLLGVSILLKLPMGLGMGPARAPAHEKKNLAHDTDLCSLQSRFGGRGVGSKITAREFGASVVGFRILQYRTRVQSAQKCKWQGEWRKEGAQNLFITFQHLVRIRLFTGTLTSMPACAALHLSYYAFVVFLVLTYYGSYYT